MLSIVIAAALQTTPAMPPAPAPQMPVAPVPPALAPSPAPAPDYTQDAAWLCRPGRSDACATNQDVTVIQANGKRKIEKFKPAPQAAFDCFYVYPTVSLDPTANSDMTAGPEENAVAAAQAARFTSKCRVFAPLYRQATLAALRSHGPLEAADPMALADVTAAWNDYVTRDNKGRGVVLIGHSQGSKLIKTLLANTIENSEMRRNIISVMIPGTNLAVPPGGVVGGDLKRIPICNRDDQYGCVITYVTFRADAPPPANSRFGRVAQPGMVAACVNPAALAGGRAETDAILWAAGAGMGSAKMGPWTSDGAPVTTPFVKVPGLISAQCTSANGFNYLAVTVNGNPADPRTDTIVGDVTVGGQVLGDWGLHLIDMPVEMGNLVDLAERQAYLWRGIKPPKKGQSRAIAD